MEMVPRLAGRCRPLVVEVAEALRRRHMVRSFDGRPVATGVVDRLVTDALRAPTAGNTRGTAWIVLDGPQTATYWEHTTTPGWRAASRRWPGLSRAPVAALALASPGAYVARYAEHDKSPDPAAHVPAAPGVLSEGGPALGAGPGAWPVPYWFGDAAFSAMALLVGATSEGLGTCFLGNFRGEAPLLAAVGVPEGWRLFGTVLLGHPDGRDHPSPSLARRGPSAAERVHRGRW